MFENILDILKSNPQIVVFLAIAIGYFIGRLKIFGFSMGSTAGRTYRRSCAWADGY